MYETYFLHDLAEQNYSKYNLEPLENITRGIMLQVNSSDTIGVTVARYYATLTHNFASAQDFEVSIPKWDSTTNGN